MFFYRQGEFTGRRKVLVRETGDEFQKGLAFCCLALIFLLCGVVLFILHAVYWGTGQLHLAKSLKSGGILMLGLGAVIGIPSIAYVLAFRKEHKQRERLVDGTMSFRHLGAPISEQEGVRLSETASKLLKQLQTRSDSIVTKALIDYHVQSMACLANKSELWHKKFHSFADFGTQSLKGSKRGKKLRIRFTDLEAAMASRLASDLDSSSSSDSSSHESTVADQSSPGSRADKRDEWKNYDSQPSRAQPEASVSAEAYTTSADENATSADRKAATADANAANAPSADANVGRADANRVPENQLTAEAKHLEKVLNGPHNTTSLSRPQKSDSAWLEMKAYPSNDQQKVVRNGSDPPINSSSAV